jgi:hypothetical protein
MRPGFGLNSLIVGALVSLSLSGCNEPASADGAPDAGPSGAPDAGTDGPLAACEAPLVLQPAPGAEARARAQLTTLSSTATLDWSATRGTLVRIAGLRVELPTCTTGVSAHDRIFDFYEAHTDLFQIDRADWQPDSPVTCESIVEGVSQTLTIRRVQYGALPLRNDVFSTEATREGGVVVLTFFGGSYVPQATATMVAALQACPDRPAIEPTVRAAPFAYAVFKLPPAPPCSLQAPGSYSAASDDSLVVAPDVGFLWIEDGGVVRFRRVRHATLRVAPANDTPELRRSDANCPDSQGHDDIGWIRSYDPVTGDLLGDQPDPVPGCIVC